MKKAMLALAAAAALVLTACEKKEEAPVTPTGETVVVPAGEATPAAETAPEAATETTTAPVTQ